MLSDKRYQCVKFIISFCQRWLKGEQGVTAIEFSLLLLPFLMLVFGIIELSLMHASASMLERSTGIAAHLIRTGQIQQASLDPQAMFKEKLCESGVAFFVRCEEVIIEAQVMQSFADYASMTPQYDEEGKFVSTGFSLGNSNDRILVRAAFEYKMITPFVGTLLNGADGKRLFMSTVVFQTEPYEFNIGGGA